MINIYPSKLDGAPLESYLLTQPDTIHGWLTQHVPSYEVRYVPPISVEVNGQIIDSAKWPVTDIRPTDDVGIYIEPHGVVQIVVMIIMIAMSIYSMMNQPGIPKNKAPRKGSALDEATAKGNKAKLNSIIREIAGTFKVYPDYLLPPHLYFVDGTEQWIGLLLCVGKGSYTIPDLTVLIGDTRISAITEDAQYLFYEPGASLAADTSAIWWHTAPEVGGTSTGKSGLELNATYAIGTAANAMSYQFDGFVITIPLGGNEFPDWPANSIITIELFLNYTVIDAYSERDIISGDFTTLAPFAGMVIEITGPNEGFYVIHSVEIDSDGIGYITLDDENGVQINGLLTGVQRMAIGYRHRQYKITEMVLVENTPFWFTRSEMHVVRYTDAGIVDEGWAGFDFVIANDAIIAIDASDQEGEWAGPFAVCPSGEVTEAVEYDLMFPSGLAKIEPEGTLSPITVRTELHWREIGGSPVWNSVIKDTTGSTLNQLGYTETITFSPAIRPEVRMRRIGAKATLTSIQDSVQWYSLKSKLVAPTSYAGVTTMTVAIRGGDRISGQADQLISVQATRKLPTRSAGAWTAATETRSITPWVAYIAKSMGYTDADLSLVDFDALGAVWDARGDYFDMSIESEGTVKGEMLNALRAGYAELTLDRGVIKPVRDQVRTVYEHMYTPQNMTEQLTRTFETIRPDENDGVDVEYIDGVTWAKETVICRLPGDIGIKTEKISIEGVTDRTRAWRIGMRQRRAQKYRRKSYKFSTELDGLNSSYMSFCALGDDVPGYSQSAILTAFTAVTGGVLLQSSEPFTWVNGVAHMVGVRKKDGTLSGPYTATRVSDYVLSIPTIDFTPDTTWAVEPPHLIFGPVTRWSYPVLITSIAHNGESKVDLEAINYDVRVYSDDNNAP